MCGDKEKSNLREEIPQGMPPSTILIMGHDNLLSLVASHSDNWIVVK
jgi:hypothetical protein